MGSAGRTFYVDGTACTADAVVREDWYAASYWSRSDDLDAASLAAAAEYWTTAGLTEHASIASFSRFGLQLLAVGAPPELLIACHKAMSNEVEHAQLCLALARRYGGKSVGPGALSLARAMAGRDDLVSVTAAVIREGCVDETLAAIEFAAARDLATDPVVCNVLRRLADDELRHSHLAWRFVQWAWNVANPRQRMQISIVMDDALFAAVRARLRPTFANPDVDVEALRAHGVLDRGTRQRVRTRALATVVVPCAREVIAPLEDTNPGRWHETAPSSAFEPLLHAGGR